MLDRAEGRRKPTSNFTGGASPGETITATLTILDDDIFADGFESGDASAGAGEVIEIAGLELGSYALDVATEGRPAIRLDIELSAALPCAALEIDPAP